MDDDTIASVSFSEVVESASGEVTNVELLSNSSFDNRDTFYFDCNDDLTYDRDDYIGWIMGFTSEQIYPLDVSMSILCTDDPCINSQLYSVNLIQDWHYENGGPASASPPSSTPTETVTPSLTPTETATPSLTPTETVTPSLTPTETAEAASGCDPAVLQCPDGSFISRDPNNNCEYPPCP